MRRGEHADYMNGKEAKILGVDCSSARDVAAFPL
jgi:hypothetical protein